MAFSVDYCFVNADKPIIFSDESPYLECNRMKSSSHHTLFPIIKAKNKMLP